jgi:hypothetical protein
MRRLAPFALLLVAMLAFGAGEARACSCGRAPDGLEGVPGPHQIEAWIYDRAEYIVRGRVMTLKAVEKVPVLFERPGFEATLNVFASIKGNLPQGDVMVVTSSDSGMCGNVRPLADSVIAKQDVIVELFKPRNSQDVYMFSLCNHFAFAPPPSGSSSLRD